MCWLEITKTQTARIDQSCGSRYVESLGQLSGEGTLMTLPRLIWVIFIHIAKLLTFLQCGSTIMCIFQEITEKTETHETRSKKDQISKVVYTETGNSKVRPKMNSCEFFSYMTSPYFNYCGLDFHKLNIGAPLVYRAQ